jgi:Lamin Tail Domain/PEP-CTERM motif
MMRFIRPIALGVCGAVLASAVSKAPGQVVINEVVKEQRNGLADGASVNPDTREFIELFNAGPAEIDLTGWTIRQVNLVNGVTDLSDAIPSAALAPGSYYVIGSAGVPDVDFTPVAGEIFTDIAARVLELRDSGSVLRDAVAYDVWRAGTTKLSMASAEQLAQVGSGFQGELFSLDEGAPNIPASWSRYRDGRDTNKNGHDFGFLPMTPGASNNVAELPSHLVPNVDGLSRGQELAQYHASFVLPRVIDPTLADANNPRALPGRSPQGGNAIVAWDPAFGGNAVYGKELVKGFNMYAYFDTTPMGVGPITVDEEWETSIYGIGGTDPFFRNPDPTNGIGQIPAGGAELVTRNGSTGVGWMYQRFEDGSGALPGFTKLVLVDFGDGGDSEVAGEWKILHTIDMSTLAANWYQLGIEYDPATRRLIGAFNNQEFDFTLDYDLLGTFFIGYREGITGGSTHAARHDPPTFDLISTALAGDYNADGRVDAADYVVWRKIDGTQGGYNAWRMNFGRTTGGPAAGQVSPVPEPASMLLMALGLVAVLSCRADIRSRRR